MIKSYPFVNDSKNLISKLEMGKDWPVVYLINNDIKLYVGETSNAYNRISQHLNNKEKSVLEKITLILDEQFHKSAVLDIEQNLLKLFAADQKFELLNLNAGQSAKHNYYQRELYLNKIEDIWNELKKHNLAINSYDTIKNMDLFKYSPYTTLTEEQNEVTSSVINDIIEKLTNNKKGISIINGGAGTGKTVLAINMIFNLLNGMNLNVDIIDEDNDSNNETLSTFTQLKKFLNEYGDLKIGFVIPMTSLRETISKVFKLTKKGFKKSMVIGPNDVLKEEYDILFVDETHRLTQRKNITQYGGFDTTCKKLDLDKHTATQLDWIVKCSKYQVLFYDENQTVKGSDITVEQFNNSIKGIDNSSYTLVTQLRCAGGQTYTNYITDIFDCKNIEKEEIKKYDLKLYDKIDDMISAIKLKDETHGLCRNVAGYSWKWISKDCKTIKEVKDKNLEDITIENQKFIWNMSNKEWILRESSINEIGCIHTTQGYDLNYVGVIFGKEIDYDFTTNEITIDLSKFYDVKVKAGTDINTVKKYIINSYKVMMLRGIKGCYVYCCNPNLRKYLEKFM